MAPKSKPVAEETLDVLDVQHGHIDACVLGTQPGYIHNRMSQKVNHDLLFPRPKRNATERATTMKHNPLAEYRASPYQLSDPNEPTLLALKAASFKKAMMAAALDLPGTKKAQIGRLVSVNGELLPIYGVPQLLMAVVRSADMNRTPDIRTRAIMPRWACRLRITFVQPLMKAQGVVRLLAAAGLYIGVGDGRNEKGALTHGGWRLVEPTDPEFLQVVNEGGRLAQAEAIDHPEPYDDETAELLSWFDAEVLRRQMKGVS